MKLVINVAGMRYVYVKFRDILKYNQIRKKETVNRRFAVLM